MYCDSDVCIGQDRCSRMVMHTSRCRIRVGDEGRVVWVTDRW